MCDSCDGLISFPGATNETLLQKFNSVNKDNEYYEAPQKRESAFIVRHYAGKVKYQTTEFREKNLDLMKADIVAVLKSSQFAFVRELVGGDPVAVFRWAILRAFIRAYFGFVDAGRRHRGGRNSRSLFFFVMCRVTFVCFVLQKVKKARTVCQVTGAKRRGRTDWQS